MKKMLFALFMMQVKILFIFPLFSSPGLGMWVSGGQINEFYEVTEIAVPVVYNTTLQQLCSVASSDVVGLAG